MLALQQICLLTCDSLQFVTLLFKWKHFPCDAVCCTFCKKFPAEIMKPSFPLYTLLALQIKKRSYLRILNKPGLLKLEIYVHSVNIFSLINLSSNYLGEKYVYNPQSNASISRFIFLTFITGEP